MFTALERLPIEEVQLRISSCRANLQQLAVQMKDSGTASPTGLLVASKLNIYYFTGTLGTGLLWIPLEGDPVLMLRKGLERGQVESPLARIEAFHTYRDVPAICRQAGSPLAGTVAIEMSGMTWAAASMLQQRLPGIHFISGDTVINRCRMIKSNWELNKLRLCGERHHHCMCHLLPECLTPGMSEREIGVKAWDIFLNHGHGGVIRLSSQGDETFLGNISAGLSGLYPTGFDGPLGVRGMHPALPYLGDAGTIWQRGQILTLDIGFNLEGYNTDKTQTFWGGPAPVPGQVAEAHAVCVEIQNNAAKRLKPGTRPSDIWRATLDDVGATPFAETFMGLGADRVRFLGHGIGLNVAEQPVIADRFDEPLEQQMVMALEPKIALPGVGMVGVENTFLITPEGGVSLTGNDPALITID